MGKFIFGLVTAWAVLFALTWVSSTVERDTCRSQNWEGKACQCLVTLYHYD